MGTYHLGLDRLAMIRNPLMRLLLRHTAWDRMPQRLTACLNGGGEVGMVLSGGVPATGRVLYTVREWAGRQRNSSSLRLRPLELLRRLRVYPDFAHFEKNGPHGAGLRSVWRLMEGWLMSSVAGVFGSDAQDAGRALSQCLEALEISGGQKEKALADLNEELERQTPYRARLFNILARRVARSRPVVFLPIVHQISGESFGIEIKPAWAWRDYNEGKVNALISSGLGRLDWHTGPEEFAVRFVKENFA
ncbi:MAG: hypothetical protein A3J74_10200 [Elusimicrobia bacterium RIFCSPHIGHO2_02_FULL_57_9]|nr:MAG: hypothetical protein A3J74_10200 [Elusimicrobia bacterium RIFCSPHIGHO2_02_FULL_57_9]